MKRPKLICLAYYPDGELNCLYVGDSMSEAKAAILEVNDDNDYTRAEIMRVPDPVFKTTIPAAGARLDSLKDEAAVEAEKSALQADEAAQTEKRAQSEAAGQAEEQVQPV